jgi:hypothetical protein
VSENAFAHLLGRECTLEDDDRVRRGERLAALAARATSRESTPEGFRFTFPPEPALAAEAAQLSVLETQCCGVAFTLDIKPHELVLLLCPGQARAAPARPSVGSAPKSDS